VWWEVIMNASRVKKYDPLNAGTVWSCQGVKLESSYNTAFDGLGVELDFSETPNREFPWRTRLNDGQLPYLLFWPL
jgi:hypothetical protein